MKRLLLPLLAALALPTAVSAESTWLILQLTTMLNSGAGAYSMEKIEVSSWDSCRRQGKEWSDSWKHRSYWCIQGK
jgi:hypothetical protein